MQESIGNIKNIGDIKIIRESLNEYKNENNKNTFDQIDTLVTAHDQNYNLKYGIDPNTNFYHV
jgi:hypothetical protein